jgi:glycosyltransferase involved in cell wall biosynthesis
VLIIVQNMSVPLDRRVWLECRALTNAGYQVSVICPRGPGDQRRQTLEGVAIYRYRPAPEARGLAGFALEFVYCWLRTALLSGVVRRERGFDVIQACNPPDTYWLLGLLWKAAGVRFVYDQHDLNPELFVSRFGEPRGGAASAEHRGLLWLERMTYRVADLVIATNESYKHIAITRGRRREDSVVVVRSGPDTSVMRPVHPPPALRPAGCHLLVYLGIMGPQDGVALLLTMMEELVHRRGRRDVHLALLGYGDCLEQLRRKAVDLGLDDVVTFTGRASPAMVADYLSAADLGLAPDLKSPLNDLSTHNKVMEYMAYCLPTVGFDLRENQVSAGPAALWAPSGDLDAFCDAVETLLDDEELRVRMGLAARERVVGQLDWLPQSAAYVAAFDRLTGHVREQPSAAASAPEVAVAPERLPVDLANEEALEDFVRRRGAPVTDGRGS